MAEEEKKESSEEEVKEEVSSDTDQANTSENEEKKDEEKKDTAEDPENNEEEEEEEEEKCPECGTCPPAGAPAWMATFADMATLLMAFFVLILSFAEMNVPKFKQISGSMKNSFGIQRLIPVVEMPKAESIIAQHFSPAQAEPTPINTIRQETTDDSQENVVKKKDDNPNEFENNQELESVKKALAKEIAEGQVEIKAENEKIVIEMTNNESQAGGKGMENQNNSGGPSSGDKNSGIVSQDKIDLFAKISNLQSEISSKIQVQQSKDLDDLSDLSEKQKKQEIDSQLAKLRADLSNEIQNGLAEVERDGDKIIVRLAEQGSFQSGRADLQESFLPLLEKVGGSLNSTKGQVRIEGHTDNVPVFANERFSSNWDLSGARAGAVADYLLSNAGITPGRIAVQGFADTKPLVSNDTSLNRAKNRRIEIIVDGQ